MNDRQLLDMLRAIRDLALLCYPIEPGSVDDLGPLVEALGKIAGTAEKAIDDHSNTEQY